MAKTAEGYEMPRINVTCKALGLSCWVLSLSLPAVAAERTLEETTVSSRAKMEMRDGKLFSRKVRSVRKNVEVDTLVPVTRTRQDPVTR